MPVIVSFLLFNHYESSFFLLFHFHSICSPSLKCSRYTQLVHLHLFLKLFWTMCSRLYNHLCRDCNLKMRLNTVTWFLMLRLFSPQLYHSSVFPVSHDVGANPSALPLGLLTFERGLGQSQRPLLHPTHLPQPPFIIQPAAWAWCHQGVLGNGKFGHVAKEPSEVHNDQCAQRRGDKWQFDAVL